MKKKIIVKALDFFITMLEIAAIERLKVNATRAQQFEDAAKLREEERKLEAKLPKIEELRTWRAALSVVEDYKDVPSKKK
jgi:hypothetical protein